VISSSAARADGTVLHTRHGARRRGDAARRRRGPATADPGDLRDRRAGLCDAGIQIIGQVWGGADYLARDCGTDALTQMYAYIARGGHDENDRTLQTIMIHGFTKAGDALKKERVR